MQMYTCIPMCFVLVWFMVAWCGMCDVYIIRTVLLCLTVCLCVCACVHTPVVKDSSTIMMMIMKQPPACKDSLPQLAFLTCLLVIHLCNNQYKIST